MFCGGLRSLRLIAACRNINFTGRVLASGHRSPAARPTQGPLNKKAREATHSRDNHLPMSDNESLDEIPRYTAQLPSATLEAEQNYPRGTVLNLNVQVRVIGFTENEDKKGNLIHKHNLALEEVSIVDFLTPAQRKALIEAAEREAEEQERLAAGGTITEEQHIEDVLPEPVEDPVEVELPPYSPFNRDDPRNQGPIVIPSSLARETVESKYDYTKIAKEAAQAEVDRLEQAGWGNDDARGYAAQGTYHETKERLEQGVSATHPAGEDDDDPEHAWMDEEEDFAHGVRVEVGF